MRLLCIITRLQTVALLFLEVGGVSIVYDDLLLLRHQHVGTGHESCVQHQRRGNHNQKHKASTGKHGEQAYNTELSPENEHRHFSYSLI